MKHKKRGISTGSIVTIIILVIVLLACLWLLPKLFGNLNTRISPDKISKSFINLAKDSMGAITDTFVTSTKEPDEPNIDLVFSTHAYSEPLPTPILKDEIVNFSLSFAGSIDFDKKLQKATAMEEGIYNISPIFENIKNTFNSDYNTINLANTFIKNEELSDINAPESLISSIKNLGFNSIIFGNSNSLNYGLEGLQSMLTTAKQNKININGIDAESTNSEIFIQNIKEIPVAFLHYTQSISSTSKKKVPEQNIKFHISIINEDKVKSDIIRAREKGAYFVVVSIDWDKSTSKNPSKDQIKIAQYIADAGANIIIGNNQNSPLAFDILSTTNQYAPNRKVPVAYSLGNLLSSNTNNANQASSIILNFNISYNKTKAKVESIKISDIPLFVWKTKLENKDVFSILPLNNKIDAENKKLINFNEKVNSFINNLFGILPISVINN